MTELEKKKKELYKQTDVWLKKVLKGGLYAHVNGEEKIFDSDDATSARVSSMLLLAEVSPLSLIPIFTRDKECFSLSQEAYKEFAYDYLAVWAGIYNEYGRKRYLIEKAETVDDLAQVTFGLDS